MYVCIYKVYIISNDISILLFDFHRIIIYNLQQQSQTTEPAVDAGPRRWNQVVTDVLWTTELPTGAGSERRIRLPVSGRHGGARDGEPANQLLAQGLDRGAGF